MKLRAIRLENVRCFTSPMEINDLGDGINVLSEPNEFGKSTLFDAIQAVFFKPHGSADKEVKALRPHAGGAPEISVEVETPEGRCTIAKRWLQKPSATIHQDGRLIAQSDAAEDWISRVLGQDVAGPSGLVWVRQGMTALSQGSTKELKAAFDARRDLMSSVSEEVEAMTGGRRMDAALKRCQDELGQYATGTGRVKAGGPWKAAQDRVEALAVQRDELARLTADLHGDLRDRNRNRRSLSELTDPEATDNRRTRLDEAQRAHAAAQKHAEEAEALLRRVEVARLTAVNAQTRLEGARQALAEQAEADNLVSGIAAEAETARGEIDAASDAHAAAQAAHQLAVTGLEQAENVRRRAERAQTARDSADRRRALENRIADAEKARKAMETAKSAIQGPDEAAMRRIEARAAEVLAAQAARAAHATQVVVTYAEAGSGRIRHDGRVLENATALPLTRSARLEVDGIGTLDIRPAETGSADPVEAARTALREALAAIGMEGLENARLAAQARRTAEQQHGEARAVFASLAPVGLDALHTQLAAIPTVDEADDTPDLPTASAACDAARDAEKSARDQLTGATERLSAARTEVARSETMLAQLHERLARARAAVQAVETDEAELASQAQATRQTLQLAEADHADMLRTAPDLVAAEAAFNRAQSVEAQAREQIECLRPELARLEERIRRASGDAVEERLAETEEALIAARADLARIDHEVNVLTRLEKALTAARTEARDRYFAPVARELRPLLNLLWPEAELTWTEDSLLPDSLVRKGQEEPLDILSGGTQEQIALLVRLAFARMLAASGRAAPVILDDALVFTDDDRIERMFNALHRQAGDLQIIVLTCRQRAFRDLGGHALRLTAPEVAA